MKVKIDIQKFVDGLQKDDQEYIFDDATIFRFLADILNEAGIEAEARYQDCDWSIMVAGEKHYFGTPLFDEPAKVLILSSQYFADAVNSGERYNAWYSYQKGEHFISFEQKKPEEVAQAIS